MISSHLSVRTQLQSASIVATSVFEVFVLFLDEMNLLQTFLLVLIITCIFFNVSSQPKEETVNDERDEQEVVGMYEEWITNTEVQQYIHHLIHDLSVVEPAISQTWNHEIERFRNEQNGIFHLSNPHETSRLAIRQFHAYLEEHHDQLVVEVKNLLATGYKGFSFGGKDAMLYDQELTNQKDFWSAIWIKSFHTYAKTAESLPTLTRITKTSESEILNLYVSILWPGAELKPHRGCCMGVLRYHYGLVIPQDESFEMTFYGSGSGSGSGSGNDGNDNEIDKQYHWKEKEGIIFDDTLLHSVINQSQQPRLVILADFFRDFDDASPWLTKLNKKVYEQGGYLPEMVRFQEALAKEEPITNGSYSVLSHF